MFASKQIKVFKSHFKTLAPDTAPYKGPSKRATSLMPSIQLGVASDLSSVERADHNRLLLSIEANQKSCCLHIESGRNKSRSAVLVYRGSAISCIYSSKALGSHLFNQEGFELAIRDLACSGSKLSLYTLSDEVVVAAAALFHGEVLELANSTNAAVLFDAACEKLIQSKKPGVMVLGHPKDLSVCMVYIFDGKIVAVYADREGRLEPSKAAVKAYLSTSTDIEIYACILPVADGQSSFDFAFSLSGLADRSRTAWESRTDHAIPNFFQYYRSHAAESEKRQHVAAPRLIMQRNRTPATKFDKQAALNHTFHVNP
jgi:hypothetical protein